jgi:hypothetical protein
MAHPFDGICRGYELLLQQFDCGCEKYTYDLKSTIFFESYFQISPSGYVKLVNMR